MRRVTGSPGRLAAMVLVVAMALSVSAVARQAAGGDDDRVLASFSIHGDVAGSLVPGIRRSIRLVLTNTNPFPMRLTRVRIRGSVDAEHRALGCSMRNDFQIRQLPRRRPLVAAHSSRRLARGRPGLLLLNDPLRNQDACQAATVTLHYQGRAVRVPARP